MFIETGSEGGGGGEMCLFKPSAVDILTSDVSDQFPTGFHPVIYHPLDGCIHMNHNNVCVVSGICHRFTNWVKCSHKVAFGLNISSFLYEY